MVSPAKPASHDTVVLNKGGGVRYGWKADASYGSLRVFRIEGRMHRVVLECSGVPAAEGEEAAADIEREFREHRRHHINVRCTFDDGKLVLQADNDFDPDELALMDEFSDCISAYIATLFDGDLRLVSSTPV